MAIGVGRLAPLLAELGYRWEDIADLRERGITA
jgi:hypothetical protein